MANLLGGGVESRTQSRGKLRVTRAEPRGETPAIAETEAEAVSAPVPKRPKVSNQPSTRTLFRDMAAGWIEKEVAYYGATQGDYMPIDNEGKEKVADDHLEKACKEYETRFAFCTEEEDLGSDQYSGSPHLLVASNLKATWETWKKTKKPEKCSRFRFALFPMQDSEDLSALFITLMPGPIHGSIDGAFADIVGEYLRGKKLQRLVDKCHGGGGTYQPDIKIAPIYPDHNAAPGTPDHDDDGEGPQNRVVVEFEFGHRNADALRQAGHAVLTHHYGSLFIGIKVWRKDASRTFGAALVVWEKDHTTGQVAVRDAFDFGTKPLQTGTKTAWNKAGTPTMLPRVPATTWNRPAPASLPDEFQVPLPPIPAGWSLVLPANAFFYRMPTSAAPQAAPGAPAGAPALAAAAPPRPPYITGLNNVDDLTINLLEYQDQIDKYLDKRS